MGQSETDLGERSAIERVKALLEQHRETVKSTACAVSVGPGAADHVSRRGAAM